MLANRLREYTGTIGTGELVLTGAVPGHARFQAAYETGQPVRYMVLDGAGNHEVGVGRLTAPDRIGRDRVIETFQAGVFHRDGVPLSLDGSGEVMVAATADLIDGKAEADPETLLGPLTVRLPFAAMDGVRAPAPGLSGGVPAGLAVTRPTSATRLTAAGRLLSAPADTLRLDFAPQRAAPGALFEPRRTNLLLHSADLAAADWTRINTTVTADATTAPDGTMTADKLVEDTSDASHDVRQAMSASAGDAITISGWFKAAGRRFAFISMAGAVLTASQRTFFDLEAGVVSSQTGNVTSATITGHPGGWYRCTMTVTIDNTGSGSAIYGMDVNGSGGTAYQGDGASGLYFWGAQLEEGALATSHIPTDTAQVTHEGDLAVIGGDDFAAQINPHEGTVYIEFDDTDAGLSGNLFHVDGGESSNRFWLAFVSDTTVRLTWTRDGTPEASLNFTRTRGRTRIAFSYGADRLALVKDGQAAVVETAFTPFPAPTQMGIGGQNLTGEGQPGTTIAAFLYAPRAVDDATLQTLTGGDF
ncbi:phage head spike fiber domain-containing protein [Yunchengibacter salinarum]|uniref:phage head spike fiber domain-containing protein n=1 Tax=Yunchengibacter salinarum TaxID=3133399 RepID=UPI0035B57ADA